MEIKQNLRNIFWEVLNTKFVIYHLCSNFQDKIYWLLRKNRYTNVISSWFWMYEVPIRTFQSTSENDFMEKLFVSYQLQ